MLPPHAVKGTMRMLTPQWWPLSPAVGLALSAGGGHLLSRLYELEPRLLLAEGARCHTAAGGAEARWRGSACCVLARELFHRNHAEEPLFPTSNQSLPAAHLSASLHAAVGVFSVAGLSGQPLHEALRNVVCSNTQLPLPQLARETGVSIARFERLVEQVRLADEEESTRATCLPRAGSALLMRHLWLSSSSRTHLATFATSLDAEARRLGFDGALACALPPPFCRDELTPQQVEHAMADLCHSPHPEAFEQLVAALALGGARSVPLLQGRYSYKDQPAVADCAELATRELLNAMLWCPVTQAFDAARLPGGTAESVRAFYGRDGLAQLEREELREKETPTTDGLSPEYTSASRRWFDIVSNLPRVRYLSGLPSKRYEMAPTIDNVIHCLGALLGKPLRSLDELQALWRAVHPERMVELSTNDRGERLTVREMAASGEGDLVLELVVSERLNHAFAIHHPATPPWQREVARRALRHWLPTPCSARDRPEEEALPRVCLLPALLQPLLLQHDLGRPVHTLSHWQRRLLLFSADPRDSLAVGTALLRELRGAARGEAVDELLVARLIELSNGFGALGDAALVQLARAAGSVGPLARQAALLHPPLCAPASIMYGGWQAAAPLWKALLKGPLRRA
ncbi:hypothetical protein AB1Y20_017396 [Prymnesium parvum]|uniref:Uncharacterized protein n=1 Tax=Prymnesium parvum TaxID=97485 RepID=A0AB34JP24_PRYPA